jgi:hypothetical protein
MALIKTQEGFAGRQVIVDNIEDLTVDARCHPRQDDGLGTVVDVGERNRV